MSFFVTHHSPTLFAESEVPCYSSLQFYSQLINYLIYLFLIQKPLLIFFFIFFVTVFSVFIPVFAIMIFLRLLYTAHHMFTQAIVFLPVYFGSPSNVLKGAI